MKRKKCPVSIRLRETPVPIPNTTVKPEAAEGTVLETARENRRMPDNVLVITSDAAWSDDACKLACKSIKR